MANLQCIMIGGSDARNFAQAQFSGDVDALAPGRWQWNAWLNPQGRVRALMHLADAGDGTLLAILRGGDAQDVCAALARYRLRTRATLAVQGCTAFAGGPATFGTVEMDGGHLVLGYGTRSLRLGTAAEALDSEAHAQWRLADIREGWPILPPGAPDLLPPALGMEHLGAVAFDKGCYPGQEIAARLHYRGGHKYRMYHLQRAAPLPDDAAERPEDVTCQVLDEVGRGGDRDALAVGPLDMSNEISLSGQPYRVITRFNP